MALDNYTGLQASVLDWLARPGDTLISGAVPDMIALFEAEAARRLYHRLGETSATLTTTAGVSTVALPAFYAEARSVNIPPPAGQAEWTGINDQLTYITPEEMGATWIGSQQGQPTAFTIQGANVVFAPIPNSAYAVNFAYLAAIPSLASASGGVTWLLTNHPDLYLFGTLVEAHAYIANDERIAMWMQRREASFASIQQADRRARWSGSVLVMRGDTGNP